MFYSPCFLLLLALFCFIPSWQDFPPTISFPSYYTLLTSISLFPFPLTPWVQCSPLWPWGGPSGCCSGPRTWSVPRCQQLKWGGPEDTPCTCSVTASRWSWGLVVSRKIDWMMESSEKRLVKCKLDITPSCTYCKWEGSKDEERGKEEKKWIGG